MAAVERVMGKALRVCVYCGSRDGSRPEYLTAAQRVGESIGRRGWHLVYGGGRVGLMGRMADAALAAGATVTGVIPESLRRREVGHTGLTQLHVVSTMHERKHRMAHGCDAFIALPGGIGTFEELFEVWSWRHLGYHDQPIGLLDAAGYFQPLVAMMAHAIESGFVTRDQRGMVHVSADPEGLLDALGQQVLHAARRMI